jgi:hypothetical protein
LFLWSKSEGTCSFDQMSCRIRLTHSYLLNIEERPGCILCNSNYLIKHVWIDCVDVNNLYDLFTNVASDTILKILKEMYLYTQI